MTESSTKSSTSELRTIFGLMGQSAIVGAGIGVFLGAMTIMASMIISKSNTCQSQIDTVQELISLQKVLPKNLAELRLQQPRGRPPRAYIDPVPDASDGEVAPPPPEASYAPAPAAPPEGTPKIP